MSVKIGVLALQGNYDSHLELLRAAVASLAAAPNGPPAKQFDLVEVRTKDELVECSGLIIPGGESTTMSSIAAQSGLLGPLRQFVKIWKRPIWGTCAGLILLAEEVSGTKMGGQELIGGLDIRVRRNHFGRQAGCFVSNLNITVLQGDVDVLFPSVFLHPPVVEEVLPSTDSRPEVQVLASFPGGMLPGNMTDGAVIVAVMQGNVLGTSFHPELTKDIRMHVWWLQQILRHL